MRFIFIAQLADGRELRESESIVWDQVPHGIVKLSLRDTENGDDVVVGIEAKPGRRFFFCNEGVAAKGAQLTPSAKIVGLVDGKKVHEYRLDFGLLTGRVQLEKRSYHLRQFEQDPSALRRAA